jgi:hypothetical protein
MVGTGLLMEMPDDLSKETTLYMEYRVVRIAAIHAGFGTRA